MVRKSFAILLLALLIFNFVGYKMILFIQTKKADVNLETLINKNAYQEKDLFTLKVAINLPYQSSQSSFERVDGEIIVNNETYRFVQRKVKNDTLYLQCIRHTEKTILQQKANDLFGKVNDVLGNDRNAKNSGKHSLVVKYASEDFIDSFALWNLTENISTSTISYLTKPFTNSGSKHLQKLIKPPISVKYLAA